LVVVEEEQPLLASPRQAPIASLVPQLILDLLLQGAEAEITMAVQEARVAERPAVLAFVLRLRQVPHMHKVALKLQVGQQAQLVQQAHYALAPQRLPKMGVEAEGIMAAEVERVVVQEEVASLCRLAQFWPMYKAAHNATATAS